jgi:hypothetical protein
VFPDEFARTPDMAVEATFTAGGIAEALEDEAEIRGATSVHGTAEVDNTVVTPLRGRRAKRLAQLGDSSEPRVSKTS